MGVILMLDVKIKSISWKSSDLFKIKIFIKSNFSNLIILIIFIVKYNCR